MDDALREDYRFCARLARHYENFPVVSRLLPARCRPHLAAVYAFARGADDIADEPEPHVGGEPIESTAQARVLALARWRAGLAGSPPPGTEPIFRALAHTRAERRIADRWLHDLLEAFRWDAEGRTYATWDELRGYADRSAAPIGRLVLGVAGVTGERVEGLSDDLCVALQYTNFWQDLSVDWPRRRDYVPDETWRAAGLGRAALRQRFAAQPIDPAHLTETERAGLRQVLGAAVQRTEALYARTRDLPRLAGPELAVYLGAVWHGGREILARVAALGQDVFVRRPRLGAWDRVRLAVLAGSTRWSDA